MCIRDRPYTELAEGYDTVKALCALADRYHVDLPIGRAVYAVLYDGCLLYTSGGEGQLARIRPALGHVHLGAALVNLADMVDMGEIEHRVNALREHVQRDGDDIEIARATLKKEFFI